MAINSLTERPPRILSLDIVRGLAAVTVFLTHLGNPFPEGSLAGAAVSSYQHIFRTFAWCNGGLHAAVVVFIVLSGFCIHFPLAVHPEKYVSGYWSHYMKRRFFRIYPVLLFATLLGLITHSVMNGWQTQNVVNLAANLSGLAALVPISPDGPAGNGILLTVIVECVLYVAYPFVYTAKRRVGWGPVLAVALVLYVANIAALALTDGPAVWFQRNFFAFLLYWVIGAFAIDIAARIGTKRIGLSAFLLLCSYLFYFAVCHLVHFGGSHYFKSIALASVAAYFLWFVYHLERARSLQGAVMSILSRVGERSYSLYATHMPILITLSFILERARLTEQGIVKYATALIVVPSVTIVVYRFIEAPSHALAKSVAMRNMMTENGTRTRERRFNVSTPASGIMGD